MGSNVPFQFPPCVSDCEETVRKCCRGNLRGIGQQGMLKLEFMHQNNNNNNGKQQLGFVNRLLTTGKNRVTADGTKDNFTDVQTLSRGHSDGTKVHGTTEGLALVGIGHNGSNDVAIDHIERGRDIG